SAATHAKIVIELTGTEASAKLSDDGAGPRGKGLRAIADAIGGDSAADGGRGAGRDGAAGDDGPAGRDGAAGDDGPAGRGEAAGGGGPAARGGAAGDGGSPTAGSGPAGSGLAGLAERAARLGGS